MHVIGATGSHRLLACRCYRLNPAVALSLPSATPHKSTGFTSADFLLELANDPKQALDLLQAAEVIEEEESKAHAADGERTGPLRSNQ